MEFRNCRRCKNIFSYSNMGNKKEFCPKCSGEILEEISKLKSIISENSDVSMLELEKRTNIGSQVINRYINAGRVPNVIGSDIKKCVKCGISIKIGRLCNKCSR